MHGIGESTANKLNSLNIYTIGDLAHANEGLLKQQLGKNGSEIKKQSQWY